MMATNREIIKNHGDFQGIARLWLIKMLNEARIDTKLKIRRWLKTKEQDDKFIALDIKEFDEENFA